MINCVYILTFANNNKRYIGTSCNPKKRIASHEQSTLAVGHAWRKYRKPDIQIVFSGSRDECKACEVRLIESLNTRNPFGYNLTCGGDGICNPSLVVRRKLAKAAREQVHTPERNRKISETMRGKPSNTKGTRLSTEHRNKISKALSGRKRKQFTKETRLKMSIAAKKRHNRELSRS